MLGHRHAAAIVLATAGVALAIAACGSSSSEPTASSNPQFALARCMRAHGVSGFPDPTKGPGGEGFRITKSVGSSSLDVDGIPFSGPAFQSAERVCKLFGGGSSPPPISERQKLAMIAKARCIRRHGVPDFPDPTFPAGGGVESGGLGPGLGPRSPAVQRAARDCANAGTAIPGVGVG